MEGDTSEIRLIVAGRRKPGMTRREFADHRYLVHAAVTGGAGKLLNPTLYSQNHVLDSALGAPAGTPNLNHPWLVGQESITELDFRDGQHLKNYFNSDHVRDVVALDTPVFADFGGLIWMVSTRARHVTSGNRSPGDDQEAIRGQELNGFDAFYFLAAPTTAEVSPLPSELLDQIFSRFSDENMLEDVLTAELFTWLPEYDLTSYFGSGTNEVPKYSAVIKLHFCNKSSFLKVRDAQLRIENESWFSKAFDLSKSFIALSQGQVVFTTAKEFDPDAKPNWDMLF
ncbi:hypothetical protein BDW75DRAFT_226541 [Aspergillus navahoensis]